MLLLSGCLLGEKRRTFSPPDEDLLRAKADPRLRKEAVEERHIVAAGFRVVTRAGPNWVVAGPIVGIPELLESDRINYIEKAS